MTSTLTHLDEAQISLWVGRQNPQDQADALDEVRESLRDAGFSPPDSLNEAGFIIATERLRQCRSTAISRQEVGFHLRCLQQLFNSGEITYAQMEVRPEEFKSLIQGAA